MSANTPAPRVAIPLALWDVVKEIGPVLQYARHAGLVSQNLADKITPAEEAIAQVKLELERAQEPRRDAS